MTMNGAVTCDRDAAAHDVVAILDAGAQYGKLIDRRVRELRVKTAMLPLATSAAALREQQYKAIIISGGPGCVSVEDKQLYDADIFTLGVPVLGICYGFHVLNKQFGGSVERKQQREDGQFDIEVDPDCVLFREMDKSQRVLLTHGDSVHEVAEGFRVVARSGDLVSAIADEQRRLYGVQFHPEVDLTVNGRQILRNFLFSVAGVSGSFSLQSRRQQCIDDIRRIAGTDCTVLLLVSGGVDSTVCAALLHEALGTERVVALHIDNGFMRHHESAHVQRTLTKLGLNLKVVDARHQFCYGSTIVPEPGTNKSTRTRVTSLLCHTAHPEHKRKIIGDTFINVANDVISELKLNSERVLLGQGTLRPDLIESASRTVSGAAQCIKTHHNDTDLVRRLRSTGRVIEPLKDFHKDEVRALGLELGVASEVVHRQPFPGPGLAIRIICADQPHMASDFSETQVLLRIIADYRNSKQRSHALLNRIDMATSEAERQHLLSITTDSRLATTLLPIQTVGVQGDGRTYSYCAALSCDTAPTDWTDLMTLARLIPRVCHNINRVCYIFGGVVQYPVLSVTPTFLTSSVVDQLRRADHIANTLVEQSGETGHISQMPVVLLPLHFDRDPTSHVPSCQRSLAIRTFITHDFMTGVPAVPGRQISLKLVEKMAAQLSSMAGISRVMYDLTSKPPGTTEWE